MKNVAVTPGQQLSVVVGNGGPVSNSYSFHNESGGASSIGSICSADGGKTIAGSNCGGDGGSGGGAGYGNGAYYTSGYSGGLGGKDGGNGQSTCDSFSGWESGGKGQHTTTRYFGESTGTLYSTGGCGTDAFSLLEGGWYNVPSSNTGDGGSAGISGTVPKVGGSGICIIRWDDQKS